MKKTAFKSIIIMILSLLLLMGFVFAQQGSDVLNPTADSYVYITYPDTNYGTSSRLEVDGSPIKIIYTKFDLTNYAGKTINKATLGFYVVDASNSQHNIKREDTNSWTETGITYNNRPALGSILGNTNCNVAGTCDLKDWVEIDITAYVSEKKGRIMSLGIDSTGSNGLDFSSKESSTNKPELVISWRLN